MTDQGIHQTIPEGIKLTFQKYIKKNSISITEQSERNILERKISHHSSKGTDFPLLLPSKNF